jgi:hypothetical protein
MSPFGMIKRLLQLALVNDDQRLIVANFGTFSHQAIDNLSLFNNFAMPPLLVVIATLKSCML